MWMVDDHPEFLFSEGSAEDTHKQCVDRSVYTEVTGH